MAFEWLLATPRLKTFKETTTSTVAREVSGVGEDGEPCNITIDETTESVSDVEGPADIIRLSAAANNKAAWLFHIRLVYGRLDSQGEFVASIRDDGILIGGPDYLALDTNDDGLITEDELLQMSAKILKWDGELREIKTLPVEGLAS
jgi:hypothetical protein